MIRVAQVSNPQMTFHCGDMSDFKLNKQFDAIICLFSSIGYTKTSEHMGDTIKNFAGHLKAGGVLIVEPWFSPVTYKPGYVSANFVDNPEIKICRMGTTKTINGISHLDIHYMVGTREGVEFLVEHHELGLFTHEQYVNAFTAADLEVEHDPNGFTGRGLYIGTKLP